jgi:hypothetical protein
MEIKFVPFGTKVRTFRNQSSYLSEPTHRFNSLSPRLCGIRNSYSVGNKVNSYAHTCARAVKPPKRNPPLADAQAVSVALTGNTAKEGNEALKKQGVKFPRSVIRHLHHLRSDMQNLETRDAYALRPCHKNHANLSDVLMKAARKTGKFQTPLPCQTTGHRSCGNH